MSAKVDNPDGSLLLNSSRQENYCQLRTCGLPKSNAYEQAGYRSKTPEVHACQLETNSRVKERIRYLQAAMAEEHKITREGQAEKFERALRMATVQGNPAGMVAAITGTNRLFGLDKQVIETHADEPMTRSEQEEADDWAEFKLWRAGQGGPRVVSIQGGA